MKRKVNKLRLVWEVIGCAIFVTYLTISRTFFVGHTFAFVVCTTLLVGWTLWMNNSPPFWKS